MMNSFINQVMKKYIRFVLILSEFLMNKDVVYILAWRSEECRDTLQRIGELTWIGLIASGLA